jgi:putative FmdB family regulatory protein
MEKVGSVVTPGKDSSLAVNSPGRRITLGSRDCRVLTRVPIVEDHVPTYQYVCTDCQNDLEAVQTFQEPALSTCPTCGGKLRKRFGAVGVVFKGSGFYRNDSRSDARSGSKSTGDKPGETKTDSKTESKSETKSDSKSETKSESKSETKSDSSSSSTKATSAA